MVFKERQYPCNQDSLVYQTYDNAVTFRCSVSDLRALIYVDVQSYVNEEELYIYMVEFGAWHAREVYPKLNGFPGYDCVRFKINKK